MPCHPRLEGERSQTYFIKLQNSAVSQLVRLLKGMVRGVWRCSELRVQIRFSATMVTWTVRHPGSILSLLVICAVLCGPGGVSVVSGADDGSRFNDHKELEVLSIASKAEENHANCYLVSSCKSECSRERCRPLTEEHTLCAKVDKNEYCPKSNVGSGCNQMWLNYDRSYVTLPPNSNSDALQTEMSKDICLQRPMDSTFKTISFPDHYSYTYYGSTSGAWRSFPGRDATDQKCANFECRRRPWYLDGISVAKQVKILIDTGNSMGIGVTGEYQRPLQTTYLHVAIDITSSLLQTLSPGDWVEVWSFNTSGAVSLGAPVNVGPYTDPNSRPELRPLDNSVRALTHSADPAPSDLATAITKSVSSFQSTATQTLKVIIVFTDGLFSDFNTTTFPTALIAQNRVKIILFKLPRNSDSDPFLLKTTLQPILCGVQGSFELLEAPATLNPLYAIRSYFSYLAKIHEDIVESKATWSNVYKSVSQELDAVTVTAPAFDKQGSLIGVAGIDVFLSEMESRTRSLVVADLSNRRRGTQPAPANVTFVCSYQNQSLEAAAPTSCSSTLLPADGVLCQATDTRNLADRVCCGQCSTVPPPPYAWWKILLICVASLLGIVISSLALYCYCCRPNNEIMF